MYDALLERCSELTECAEALDAELWLTQLWGDLLANTPATAPLDLVMLDLVDGAEPAGTANCLILLHTMAVLDVRGCGVAARAAVQRLTARRGDQPDAAPWLDRLGAVRLSECHRYSDAFDEQVVQVCEFDYLESTGRHAVLVSLDLTNRGTLSGIELAVTQAALSDVFRRLSAQAERGRGRFEAIPAQEATDLLRSSLQTVSLTGETPAFPPPLMLELQTSVQAWLPMLAQRVTAVSPGGAVTTEPDSPIMEGPVASTWPAEQRAGLVAEFLDARQAQLRGVESPEMIAARWSI